MATIKLNDGTDRTIEAKKAEGIWQVLNGEIQPSREQLEYCSRIRRIYLNWRKAPDSYIYAHADAIKPLVLNYFMCTREGKLTVPEYDDKDTRRVARLLNLI